MISLATGIQPAKYRTNDGSNIIIQEHFYELFKQNEWTYVFTNTGKVPNLELQLPVEYSAEMRPSGELDARIKVEDYG